MPEFRRAVDRGGTFFFTVVTYRRRPIFHEAQARFLLREAMQQVRTVRPFTLDAIVLLPDHLHCIWTLPDDDTDFSTRWRRIKERFTRAYLTAGGVESKPTIGQERKGLRGVWQPRFWEHVVRDERDYQMHADYIHFTRSNMGTQSVPTLGRGPHFLGGSR